MRSNKGNKEHASVTRGKMPRVSDVARSSSIFFHFWKNYTIRIIFYFFNLAMLVAVALVAVVVLSVHGEIPADEITSLPGWSGALPSKQYSCVICVAMSI